MVIVDVKDTVSPEHIVVVGEGKIVIVGVTAELTVIVVVEEVTFVGLAQLAFEVKTQ